MPATVNELNNYHKNPRVITEPQYQDLKQWLAEFGDLGGIVHCLNSNEIISANQRCRVFTEADAEIIITEQYPEPTRTGTVALGYVAYAGERFTYRAVRWTAEQRERANIIANKAGGSWDWDKLANEFDVETLLGAGFTPEELHFLPPPPPPEEEIVAPGPTEAETEAAWASLAERFIVPPFSVLDTRQGYWQERKQRWLALGLKSEEGRALVQASLASAYRVKKNAGSNRKTDKATVEVPNWAVTSIFDPVLTEVLYTWFCPPGGAILDPFAGGSVRGLVAAVLGRPYTGIDLREEQVTANYAQAQQILPRGRWQTGHAPPTDAKANPAPEWITGDSGAIPELLGEREFDFLFSCPPYFDLEQYSEDERDLSNLDWLAFQRQYRQIIALAAQRLRPNRFACFVVGEIRGPNGAYRNLVAETLDAFTSLPGVAYYNEIILVNVAGTVPVRVSGQFPTSRKIGKVHQNILVFWKGDPRQVSKHTWPVEITDLPAEPKSE